jgi:hypothetical protein
MDYTKPVMSLLSKLQKENVAITHVFEGEEWERVQPGSDLKVRKDATEIITSVDESYVHVKHDGVTARLMIVLGNDASEILADWSVKVNTTLDQILDKVSEEFYQQWEKV